MIFWALPVAFLAWLLVFGWSLLRRCCARKERAADWEEKKVAESGDAVWQEAFRAGRAFLANHETEDIEVQSEDGFLLHGVLLPHIAPRATVILFHGWRSSWELDFTCVLPFLHAQRLQCLLVDQRAQGDSEGRWITYGVREKLDVPVWVDYIAKRFGAEHPIFLQGLSMGATTVMMASDIRFSGNVRGIVADCGFTSPLEIIAKVWRDRTPFPSHFAMWFLDQYTRQFADFSLSACDTRETLAKTAYPVLLIHGTADRLVPSYMSKQNCEACAGEKTLLLVEGADHAMSYLVDRTRVEAAYRAFVDGHLE